MILFGAASAKFDAARIHELRESILWHASDASLSPAIIAGIISRETGGDPQQFIGDNGHGFGPMQVDIGTDPVFCEAYKAGHLEPDDGIQRGCHWLNVKLGEIRKFLPGLGTQEKIACAVAGYNCGVGNVLKALRLGQDRDKYTAHANYSADVLARASWFLVNGYSEEDLSCQTH